jgi:hypothetical protein
MLFDSYDPTDDPPRRIDDWLDLHVHNYEKEVRAFWGIASDGCPDHLPFEAWQDAQQIESHFDSLFGSLRELALNPRALRYAEQATAGENPLNVLPRLCANTYLQDRIQIEMAYQGLDKWLEASRRASMLLLGRQRLNDIAQGYVRRATELYLWSFDLEAIIMASCTLEEVLRRELAELPLEQHGVPRGPDQQEWGFWQLIDGATAIGVFSKEDQSCAHAIRQLRNELLHDLPTTDQMAFKVLWDLYGLLAKLIPARGHLIGGHSA